VTRLNLVVEGQTEEAFVRDVLGPHLLSSGIACAARCVVTARRRGRVFKGGLAGYQAFRKDLEIWMKQDQNPEAYFSMMADLYGLPDDFPGYHAASRVTDVHQRVALLEDALRDDLAHPVGHFLPYTQTHEFEALLFTRPQVFDLLFPDRPSRATSLAEMATAFRSPEHIDDENPPSKRILSVFPDYRKVTDGPILVAEIGLVALRENCLHFHEWLGALEALRQRG
jgi:hypothetical protein